MGIFSKILSAGQGKAVKEYNKKVDVINSYEPEIKQMTNQEIIDELRDIRRILSEGGSEEQYILRVFALCREHIYRKTGQRGYDVQMIAALALNDGHIAEQQTGEGKTRTSHFAIMMNALAGRQVHVVTVNEYLAGRDADLCREAVDGTGIAVGYIYSGQSPESKRQAYSCDVVYGTPSEFGFDYLRDNMVGELGKKVQTKHDYAIVDEVDSVLIDEARTPLIISGAGTKSLETYKQFARVVPRLKKDVDFEMDEAKKTIMLTEVGLARLEELLGVDELYSLEGDVPLARFVGPALKAQFLYHRDKDYLVRNGEVLIIDPNTGRTMEGRRWSEGLHQAIEAKEKVEIQQETETMATVTLQNFFRLYGKLAGMTGTAMTEDTEFRKTYNMGVVAVPTNKPVIRKDMPDVVYKSEEAKYNAIVEKIKECHAKGQPVLVGTVSVENSEKISRKLKKTGIKHDVLNAKNHEREAHIVAQAGRYGAVTIATNMAGRGTDIILGGNAVEMLETYKQSVIAKRQPDPDTGEVDDYIPEEEIAMAKAKIDEICGREHKLVLEAGGLAVIGSERHESRRIDNQLRGRSGRQGDPGYSQFYISLDDDLMRLFGQDRMASIQRMMERANIPDDMPLDASLLSNSIEHAQHQVESMHYEQRKNTLEYDDVMNKQRLAIYAERDALMGSGDISDKLDRVMHDVSADLAAAYCDDREAADDWNWEQLTNAYEFLLGEEADSSWISIKNKELDCSYAVEEHIYDDVVAAYEHKKELAPEGVMDQVARQCMLRSIDAAWKDHLSYMTGLKNTIHLRSYGQRDPKVEYKDESYKAFEAMVDEMYQSALTTIMRVPIIAAPQSMPIHARKDLKREGMAVPGSKIGKHAPRGSAPLQRSGVVAVSGTGTSTNMVNLGLGDDDVIVTD